MDIGVKILIVEDEIMIADYIKELLYDDGFTNLAMAHDIKEALHEMNSYLPDIILLDINLNGKNSGIDLAKLNTHNAAIIFLTGQYDQSLMSRAFETNPEAYLTKPIQKSDLLAAVQLQLHKMNKKFITIKQGYTKVKLNMDEVLFIKSDNNYLDIQLIDRKISIRQAMNTFYDEIPSKKFIRIHRSYIVNKTKITSKSSTSVFINEFEIPCSRNYMLPM